MKRILVLLFVLTVTSPIEAQTISLGQITQLSYCAGDTLTVPYQASGTFATDNLFIAQLSDANGSFTNFTFFDSSKSTIDSLLISMQTVGNHYRVRIESTDPYTVSEDNGTDIQVIPRLTTNVYVQFSHNPINNGWPLEGDWEPLGVPNRPILFSEALYADSGSFAWQLDQDANPIQSISPMTSVIYATPGIKNGIFTFTNTNGCSSSVPFHFKILPCNPVIPEWAQIVTGNVDALATFDTSSAVWVKAGGSFTADDDFFGRTIFVEAGGAAISSNSKWNVYYVKNGGSFSFGHSYELSTVILSSESPLSFPQLTPIDTCSCDSLEFDYSQIQASVAENPPPSNLTILQSGDHLFANDEGLPIEIRISNLLGVEVLSQRGSGALDVDLSLLPAGVYFAVIEAGNDRTVRRIAVVH